MIENIKPMLKFFLKIFNRIIFQKRFYEKDTIIIIEVIKRIVSHSMRLMKRGKDIASPSTWMPPMTRIAPARHIEKSVAAVSLTFSNIITIRVMANKPSTRAKTASDISEGISRIPRVINLSIIC